MTKKTTNSSRKRNLLSFSRATKSDFRTLLSWRERGLSDKMKEELLRQYLEWAEKPDSLDYLDFCREIGVPYRTFQDWFKDHEDVRMIHEYVKHTLASRFQKRARFPKRYESNPDAFMKTLRMYHPDWREAYEEEAAVRLKSAEKGASNITVEMAPVPDCPEVPTKPEGTE